MPRNVRNFWIELNIDGKKTQVASGPRTKDGGFSLTIAMRSEGEITRPIFIRGQSINNGELHLSVFDNNNHDDSTPVFFHATKR